MGAVLAEVTRGHQTRALELLKALSHSVAVVQGHTPRLGSIWGLVKSLKDTKRWEGTFRGSVSTVAPMQLKLRREGGDEGLGASAV